MRTKQIKYGGYELSVRRGSFYTEVWGVGGNLMGRSRVTRRAIEQAKRYIDVVNSDKR